MKMWLVRAGLGLLLLFPGFAAPVAAASLSFDTVASGPNPSGFDAGDATITLLGSTGTIFTYNSSEYPSVPGGGAFCATVGDGSFGDRCIGDAVITFDDPVSDLTFRALFGGPGDYARITIYAGDTQLAYRDISGNTLLDFTGYLGVTRVLIDDRSKIGDTYWSKSQQRWIRVGTGFAFGDFFVETNVVPLPAGGSLLLAALAALAVTRRARRA